MATKLPIFVQKKSLPMPGKDYTLDLPVGHLSYSQISLYLKCPAQYYHRYVLGMSQPNSVYFFEGKCIHHVMEQTARRWVKKKKHLEFYDAAKEYREFFRRNVDDVETWFDSSADQVYERAVDLLRIMFEGDGKFLDLVQPTTIKKKLGVELKWKHMFAGVPVVGVTDLLTPTNVWDYKVVSKTPNADDSLQLSVYSAVHNIANVGLIAFVKTKTPVIKIIPSVRKPRKTKQWLDVVVSRVAFGISNKIWTPCEGELSWWCSPKWCGVWDQCRGF